MHRQSKGSIAIRKLRGEKQTIINFLNNKAMKNLFLQEDVFTSEMDEVLGGVKVKITVTRPDGTKYEMEVEW